MSVVKAENIVKTYGQVTALKNVGLEIERGEIFGIIGPDGAGKTSLFRILTTLLLPDSGSATVEGYDVVKDFAEIRKLIGYMPGRFSLYQDLSIEENLNFFATLYGTTLKENYDLIKDIYSHIEPFKQRRAGKLSGGMKQKLALSCTLIHRPSVLFLDEPTTGIDPVSRTELWDMLVSLKQSGITVVASTPYMDEAMLCDRIALMQEGECVEIAPPQQIIDSYKGRLISVKAQEMYKLLIDLRAFEGVTNCFAYGDTHHARVEESLEKLKLLDYLESKGHNNIEVKEIKPTIEDCFISIQQERTKESSHE